MNTHARFALFLIACFSVGCAPVDRSRPPVHESPELVAVGGSASVGAEDRLASVPTWYDLERRRIVQLRAGVIAPVADEMPAAEPEELRVFDDGSFVYASGSELHLHPLSGETSAIDIDALELAGIDGVSIDDFWFGNWSLDPLPGLTDDYGVCHVVDGAVVRCIGVPNVGGFTGQVAVGADGSIYVTDRDDALMRVVDGTVTEIARFEGGVTAFQRSGDTLLATTYMSGTYVVEGATLSQMASETHFSLVGSPSDYYYLAFDSQEERDDPACRDGWLTRCDRHTIWSSTVVYRVSDGHTTEVGFEDCIHADESECPLTTGLALDGDELVVLGRPLRHLGSF